MMTGPDLAIASLSSDSSQRLPRVLRKILLGSTEFEVTLTGVSLVGGEHVLSCPATRRYHHTNTLMVLDFVFLTHQIG